MNAIIDSFPVPTRNYYCVNLTFIMTLIKTGTSDLQITQFGPLNYVFLYRWVSGQVIYRLKTFVYSQLELTLMEHQSDNSYGISHTNVQVTTTDRSMITVTVCLSVILLIRLFQQLCLTQVDFKTKESLISSFWLSICNLMIECQYPTVIFLHYFVLLFIKLPCLLLYQNELI